jgi:hypothetical protein
MEMKSNPILLLLLWVPTALFLVLPTRDCVGRGDFGSDLRRVIKR